MAGGGSTSPLFWKWKYECSCSSDRQSSQQQLSPCWRVHVSTCSSSGFVRCTGCDFKTFPANPVLSRFADQPTCSARGAIRGLTLPRWRLLKTDRLSGTPRSSHLKHAAIASCCRNDHAPVIGTRESPLVRKHVGLQIKSCLAKLLRMTCAASSRSAVMHSSVERQDTGVGWKARFSVDTAFHDSAWTQRAAFRRRMRRGRRPFHLSQVFLVFLDSNRRIVITFNLAWMHQWCFDVSLVNMVTVAQHTCVLIHEWIEGQQIWCLSELRS